MRVVVFLVIAIGVFAPGTVSAAPRYTDWSAPVWLGATVNSTVADNGPALSKNGLTLYITSTRPRTAANETDEDLWVSYRQTLDSAWGAPMNLGLPINTSANDRVPTFSRDEHWMYFSSSRSGSFDLWRSYRLHTHEDFGPFGWQAPERLSGVNTDSFNEVGPSYFEDASGRAHLLFVSNRDGGQGDTDIYTSAEQPDGSFGEVSNVAELNTPVQDARPAVSRDGLEIYFHSDRAPGPRFVLDIWSATRDTFGSAWSTPKYVDALNTDFQDGQPFLSADGQTLYFFSQRPGGRGAGDLWLSTREHATGKP